MWQMVQGHSNYSTSIGNHVHSTEPCHFRWLVMVSETCYGALELVGSTTTTTTWMTFVGYFCDLHALITLCGQLMCDLLATAEFLVIFTEVFEILNRIINIMNLHVVRCRLAVTVPRCEQLLCTHPVQTELSNYTGFKSEISSSSNQTKMLSVAADNHYCSNKFPQCWVCSKDVGKVEMLVITFHFGQM